MLPCKLDTDGYILHFSLQYIDLEKLVSGTYLGDFCSNYVMKLLQSYKAQVLLHGDGMRSYKIIRNPLDCAT